MSKTARQQERLHSNRLGAELPDGPRRIRTVGIIGAGVMGRGIAVANVRAGLRVSLFDANPAAAQCVVREILDAMPYEPLRGPHFVGADRIRADEFRATGIRAVESAAAPGPPTASVAATVAATVAASLAELAHADLVIEAVPEDMAIKTAVLSRLDECLSPRTIVASNASSIPISSLARSLTYPGRLCGLHFCHPVDERPLVEVIGAESTSSETVRAACEYALALGKRPVVVRDSPGFLLNRVLSPYLTESLGLLLEGASPEQLDQSALEFGMPWGPLRQLDEFGIDVALAVGATLLRAFPDRYLPSEMLIAMYKAGRHGRKSGGGFYSTAAIEPSRDETRHDPLDGLCDDARDETLDPQVREIIRQRRRGTRRFTAAEVTQRLFLPMLLEATRALEDSVVDQPAVVDAALRDGLGMTRRYRGLFGWANDIGPATLLQWLESLRGLGDRFVPTATLRRAVAERTVL